MDREQNLKHLISVASDGLKQLVYKGLDLKEQVDNTPKPGTRSGITRKAGLTVLALYALSGPIGRNLEDLAHKLPEEIKDAFGRRKIDEYNRTLIVTESEHLADAVAAVFIPPIESERQDVPERILLDDFDGRYLRWTEYRSIFPWLRVQKQLEYREYRGKEYSTLFVVKLVGRKSSFFPFPNEK